MTTAEKKYSGEFVRETYNGGDHDIQHGTVTDNSDDLQRHLGNRQIQLIAIGGSIGTALFVSIGGALNKGGPLGMLLAYAGYSCVIALVNNSMAEMATYMPVSGGFIRMAGKWVDEAFGNSHAPRKHMQRINSNCRLHGWMEFLPVRGSAHSL